MTVEFDFTRVSHLMRAGLVSGRGHYESVVQAVMEAQHSVWIATANLKELMVEDTRARPGRARSRKPEYRSVLAVLDELCGRGVELRVLHAGPPSRPFREELGQHPRLHGGGLAMRCCPRNHSKLVIIDGELLYLGSANWTGAGLGAKGSGRRNFELGFIIRDDLVLDDVQGIYNAIWTGQPCAGCRLRDECPQPLDGDAVDQRRGSPSRPLRRR